MSVKWSPGAADDLERATEKGRDLDATPVKDVPAAMLNYFAERMVRVGKHAGGREGQRAKAHMQAHGTFGKAKRRRRLAARRRQTDMRVATLAARSATSNRDL